MSILDTIVLASSLKTSVKYIYNARLRGLFIVSARMVTVDLQTGIDRAG